MKSVSIMILTYNRVNLATETIVKNLQRTGTDDYEILICDQGTKDPAFIKFLESLNPVYFRQNEFNEGISRSLNQLMIRAKTKHVFWMPDDILLPFNWLKAAIAHAEDIPQSGIIGFEGQEMKLPPFQVKGLSGKTYDLYCQREIVHEGCQVYGSIMLTRSFIENIGYFSEEYIPYGYEDADICFRAHLQGLLCYMIPGMVSHHLGVDRPEERDMYLIKTAMLRANEGNHRWRMNNYHRIGFYVPAPMHKEPYV